VARAEQLLTENCPADLRCWEWHYVHRLCHADLFTLKAHPDHHVYSVAFSPDGKHLATASWDKTVKLSETSSGQELFTFNGHTGRVHSVAFSPNGKRLASASDDKTVKVWDAQTGQEVQNVRFHCFRNPLRQLQPLAARKLLPRHGLAPERLRPALR
jgi:WD40 repeat protein